MIPNNNEFFGEKNVSTSSSIINNLWKSNNFQSLYKKSGLGYVLNCSPDRVVCTVLLNAYAACIEMLN